ncbi:hypothetical protein NC651_007103 [Populus alba x Populus x berolinensis]|nr:hypothetical protein NC651_007103 [Populus alba x Populus x berolinensis]
MKCCWDNENSNPKRILKFLVLGRSYLAELGSDHRPILDTNRCLRTRRTFKIDSRWVNRSPARSIVQARWSSPVQGFNMFGAFTEHKRCLHELVNWFEDGSSNFAKKLAELLKKELESLKNSNADWILTQHIGKREIKI